MAVGQLEDLVIDWSQSFNAIAADLAGLVTVNDIERRKTSPRMPNASWGKAGERAVRAFWGEGAERPVRDRPRDVLMVGSLRPSVLVTMHAIRGSRPDWIEETPQPSMVQALKGPNAMIVGECKGRNLYTIGSYCPLRWEPSPLSILSSRADYVAWHKGLVTLAETLDLKKFVVLPPKASATPWWNEQEDNSNLVPVLPTSTNDVRRWGTLPLAPERERMGAPLRVKKASAVRSVG